MVDSTNTSSEVTDVGSDATKLLEKLGQDSEVEGNEAEGSQGGGKKI